MSRDPCEKSTVEAATSGLVEIQLAEIPISVPNWLISTNNRQHIARRPFVNNSPPPPRPAPFFLTVRVGIKIFSELDFIQSPLGIAFTPQCLSNHSVHFALFCEKTRSPIITCCCLRPHLPIKSNFNLVIMFFIRSISLTLRQC